MNKFDIGFVSLENRGSIQGGVRPCVVVQNNLGNEHSPTTIVVPITSVKKRSHLKTHVDLKEKSTDKITGVILCEQIITINKKDIRIVDKIKKNSVKKQVDYALKISLNIF